MEINRYCTTNYVMITTDFKQINIHSINSAEKLAVHSFSASAAQQSPQVSVLMLDSFVDGYFLPF
jgi:hypothetical protein